MRTLHQKTLLEIRDLDKWIDEEEVADSVATAIGTKRDAVRLLSLRMRYGGTQTALILAPTASSRNVLAQGRIRVGIVSCRMRQGEQEARCFRCLSFGHMSKDCDGPDRSKCCKRGGNQGHVAKDCSAVESDAAAFVKILEIESRGRGAAEVRQVHLPGGCKGPHLCQALTQMIRVLQINVGVCRAALDLALASAAEKGIDVIALSEQYHDRDEENGWYADASGRAAIVVLSVQNIQIAGPRQQGFR